MFVVSTFVHNYSLISCTPYSLKDLILFVNMNANHSDLGFSCCQGGLVSNHVVYSKVCYRSSTDEPLSSCDATIRRQEALEPTDGIKDLILFFSAI